MAWQNNPTPESVVNGTECYDSWVRAIYLLLIFWICNSLVSGQDQSYIRLAIVSLRWWCRSTKMATSSVRSRFVLWDFRRLGTNLPVVMDKREPVESRTGRRCGLDLGCHGYSISQTLTFFSCVGHAVHLRGDHSRCHHQPPCHSFTHDNRSLDWVSPRQSK